MTLFSAMSVLAMQFAVILAEETETAEAGGTMGPVIWVVVMVLFVVLAGAVWAITNRIQPPSDH